MSENIESTEKKPKKESKPTVTEKISQEWIKQPYQVDGMDVYYCPTLIPINAYQKVKKGGKPVDV